MDIVEYNSLAWDNYVDNKDRWTIPVSFEEIEEAKKGNWGIVLTPSKAVPLEWFPDLKGLDVLGLASGGGQQAPILATLGAKVSVFDNSEKQLLQDKKVSDKYNLGIKTFRGDMGDLSVFEDGCFDLVFNPCSILFVENVIPVWNECYRVLRPGGLLMTGLINPLAFQIDEDDLSLIYNQPYSDLYSLPKHKVRKLKDENGAFTFGHSLSDQIGGQLQAGFIITDMYEDDWNGEGKLDKFFPGFIATRAVKTLDKSSVQSMKND